MPLVRVDLRRGKSREYRAAVLRGIQRALTSELGVPIDDCFQVLTEHGPDHLIFDPHYLGIERTDDVVFIQIALRRGRTPAARQALYRAIVANLVEEPGMRSGDVLITVLENDPVDWSVGDGEAQLLQALPPQLPTYTGER